jgi:hypothetical protein
LATFSLLQVFEDALLEIEMYANSKDDDLSRLHNDLLQKEDSNFQLKSLSKAAPGELLRPLMDETMFSSNDISFFAKSISVCRTGLYPSEARIRRILRDPPPIGNSFSSIIPSSINKSYAGLLPTWTLATGAIADINDPACTVTTAIDHRDYYNVHYEESWKTLVVPTLSELNEYFHKGTKIPTASDQLHGYIAICAMVYCPFNKCQPGMLKRTALYDSTVSIEVNGIKVSNGTKFSECDILYHDDYNVDKSDNINNSTLIMRQQRMKFPANENGQYNISVKVNTEATYFQISSIVLW